MITGPAMAAGQIGLAPYRSPHAHKPSVIRHDGTLRHFYCAVAGTWPDEVRGISVARSKPW